jgi:AcrR family transcriptional regulator
MLQQAFALLARQGYGQVTMRQIAGDLGVSTGTLYHYFPSKEALFEQAVIRVVDRDLAAWEESIDPEASLDAKLRTLFALILRQREELTSALLLTIDFYRRSQPTSGGTAIMAMLEDYVDAVATLLALPREICAVMLAALDGLLPVSYTHLTLPTTPYV